jgi:hypothetical protein
MKSVLIANKDPNEIEQLKKIVGQECEGEAIKSPEELNGDHEKSDLGVHFVNPSMP